MTEFCERCSLSMEEWCLRCDEPYCGICFVQCPRCGGEADR